MNIDPESPRAVRTVPSELEAAAIVAALANQGIEALTTGGYTSGFRAEAPGWVKVVVKSRDLEQADRILVQLEANPEKVDWSKFDVGTPDDES